MDGLLPQRWQELAQDSQNPCDYQGTECGSIQVQQTIHYTLMLAFIQLEHNLKFKYYLNTHK